MDKKFQMQLDQYFNGLKINENEAEDFQKMLSLKGIERYSNLYKCVSKEYTEKITYETLSQYYRYDIKLRRALYKIVSFIEIAMRSQIANEFLNLQLSKDTWESAIKEQIGATLSSDKKDNYIKYKIGKLFYYQDIHSLFDLLENCDMQILNWIFLSLKAEAQRGVFKNNIEYLKENLDAMRQIRNAVGHNHILLAEELSGCYIDGKKYTSLQKNVENIILLSPDLAKDNLKRTINGALIIDENKKPSEENLYQLKPKFKVFFEKVGF